ncbi:dynamin family protein [Aestuariibius sp. 2305UL40-4]|uniref:dynamin family protein n=1 Tax=Aestuariibius violaceus TaxID=3234132 RepID=UPI00345E125A
MRDLKDQDVIGKPAAQTNLLRIGMERLDAFVSEIEDVEDSLNTIADIGGADIEKKTRKLSRQLRTMKPSIAMIGQIKAGKTSLVNAMIGKPEFLPADVNPWTSVVTSLHINAPDADEAPMASFRFFDQNEWDHLVSNGGRIGELSSRAGADDELEKVREQIAMMREKTKERLGRKFELLLGQKHDYGHVDKELVERYVCLGDDFGEPEEGAEQQGRFADITKSADLYMERPEYPMSLCIRDTPGVNDTFMIREQITINALRESRICVVVLSAHQALTSMDMALIRLIANVKSREVLIFVNRIDELSEPATQVEEIRQSILETLASNDGPENPEIIFGSAYWANMAMTGDLHEIVEDSAGAMFNWAEVALGEDADTLSPAELVWQLSGMPHLLSALAERVIEGDGGDALSGIKKSALNLVGGLMTTSQVVSMRLDSGEIAPLDKGALEERLKGIETSSQEALTQRLDKVVAQFSTRIEQSHRRFLDRALESLITHLETKGENEMWQYSPNGLRMLLRSSYQVLRRNYTTACEQAFAQAAEDIAATYTDVCGVSVDGFSITPPDAPNVPAPVSLGQTIALDLQTAWWKGWWQRRKGYRAFASSFYELIEAETAPIIEELRGQQTEAIRASAMQVLGEFVAEQRDILTGISDKADVSVEELQGLFGVTAQQERDSLLRLIYEELGGAEMPEPVEA